MAARPTFGHPSVRAALMVSKMFVNSKPWLRLRQTMSYSAA